MEKQSIETKQPRFYGLWPLILFIAGIIVLMIIAKLIMG